MESFQYEISCHCGAISQILRGINETWPPGTGDGDATISLCHCDTCRHTTGTLCTSYLRVCAPSSVEALRFHDSSPAVRRYFCNTCGCHIFYRHEKGGRFDWSVATGVISDCQQESTAVQPAPGSHGSRLRYTRHVNVVNTQDGGLSPFLLKIGDDTMQISEEPPEAQEPDFDGRRPDIPPSVDPGETLQASCHCGTVRFHLTRPNDASRAPYSALADLLVPYKLGMPETKNAENRKWWLRPEAAISPTHYLAGTCTCKSCRLISGFEIQTWAFVPRHNIVFHLPTVDGQGCSPAPSMNQATTTLVSLDFATLPNNILRTYESSPGVLRESCVNCGATVFWHDKWHRPDLIDVSVGLLRAPAGARAETWLDWWKNRVSFSEDTELGRTGLAAEMAKNLVKALEDGLQSSVHGL